MGSSFNAVAPKTEAWEVTWIRKKIIPSFHSNVCKCQRSWTWFQMWSPRVIIERLKCKKARKTGGFFMGRWSSVYLAGAGVFFSSLPSTLKPLFSSNNPKHSDATCSMRAKRRLESSLQSRLDYIRIQCILRGTFEGNLQPKELVATACVSALYVCLNPFHSKSTCHHAGGSQVQTARKNNLVQLDTKQTSY